MGWALTRKTANPYAKLVLAILANRSDAGGWSYMSQTTIAKQSGLSRRTVLRMMALLEQEGHIRRMKRITASGARTSDHVQIWPAAPCATQSQPPVSESHTIPSSSYEVDKGKEGKELSVGVPKLSVVGGTEA